ncbi:polyamine aminopropyltransferase [Peptostreptococcus equinus]|uniref:Polyamine aminopropyltransferase n=1 Tax=Peptostreptococcus equinus TaxID=3003601 RepID=A0ABY7JRB2_9FIRM|nr:polyamine aminopropyltransferase [Peptostreptococcus sp. CBA3647]WAW15396.1 polyamine aminopropyltransferase [Peptostreptococcus sp. CBA3647]
MSKKYKILMLTTLVISGCSVCYELIISAVSSYLLGNSTLQYSITIGLYMCALGLGSYISRFFTKNLFNSLVKIELLIGLVGGFSALCLFLANLYIVSYDIVMYLLIISIGTLAGAEIPIIARIIENDENNLKLTLSSLFSFDYIGGLLGSIAFPLLLLPKLGYFATAFLCGFLNISAAIIIIYKYWNKIDNVKFYKVLASTLAISMAIGMVFAENISKVIEGGLYRDKIILIEQTKYQKIVMTKHKDDIRLYIDGNCQFSTDDEYRYHEALVHVPMSKVKNKNNILILGGGDGLAVREVLKYNVKSIDLVDLDAEMIKICSTDKNITDINKNSLKSKKLKIYSQDAYKYLESNKKKYDLVIVDLPDPNSESLNKLYSNVFYRLCKKSMNNDAIMVVQSTSPYYATKAFWSINKTIESEGFNVKPYHVQVPAFGDWGFNMGSMNKIDNNFKIEKQTRFLSNENINSIFTFAKDEKNTNVEINRLTKPVLMQYYNNAVENWNQ